MTASGDLPPTGPVERFTTWTSPPVDMMSAPTEVEMRLVPGFASIAGGVVTMVNVAATPNDGDEIEIVVDSVAPGDPPPLEVGAVDGNDYVAPDAPALFGVPIPDHPEVREIVGRFVEEMDWRTHWRNYADRVNKMAMQVIFDRAMEIRFDTSARPIEEIRARAATSRYWAQRLRWLRKRGRA